MTNLPIIVAGGGISGLFCAMQLADAGHHVLILESSADRWGGRIETEEMDGFIAEYGPMRFEPTLQPRFAQLCAKLGVELVDFSGPSAEEMVTPDSDLSPEEQTEAEYNLREYALLVWRIYKRVKRENPDILTEMLKNDRV